MTPYATLAQAKGELKATGTVDDAKLLENIRQASVRIDRLFHSRRPYFAPWNEARIFPVDGYHVNSYDNTFYFGENLLALTALSIGSDTITVPTIANVWPTSPSPYKTLRLTSSGGAWYDYCESGDCTAPLTTTITGVWGFHRDYSNAWQDVDSITADITAGATSFIVNDADGADAWGVTPRLSAGNVVKLDSEYMEVTATNTTTNVVSVKRAIHGTTAAAHTTGARVYVWDTEEAVRRAVERQAAYMYARRGAYESSNITDVGQINFPADLLAELRGVVAGYAYE